jgi:hypothetical protein
MKRILLTIAAYSIINFSAHCMEETSTIETNMKKTYSYEATFNTLQYGCINEKSINVVKMNNTYINAHFQNMSPVNSSSNYLDFLVRQDPEVEGIGCGYFGINVNAKEGTGFIEYFSKTSDTDILIIKTNEDTLTDEQIAILNASPANILLLIAVNGTSDLARFEAIINQLNSRVKFALSDRTETGIKTNDIERIITNPNLSNLFYLAAHNLSDEAVLRIAESRNLQSLASLCLCRSNITQIGALTLAQSTNFPMLAELVLDKRALGDVTQEAYQALLSQNSALARASIVDFS